VDGYSAAAPENNELEEVEELELDLMPSVEI